ncbi:MAG: DNA (cytosine-5-)-methyltransferase [Sarcina sp.]
MKRTYSVGSLFAGVGGICLGFKNAKFNMSSYNIEWANEMDEYACETYRNNFEHNLIQGDLEKLVNPEIIDEDILALKEEFKDLDDEKNYNIKLEILNDEKKYYIEKNNKILNESLDILVGGFPCQPFSLAGNRLGFEDRRGNLFYTIMSLVDKLKEKPQVIFLENVKNLKTHDKGNTYKVMEQELINRGYSVKSEVLNTMNYSNIPQNRERIFIVAFLDSKKSEKFTLFDRLNEIKNTSTIEERKKDIKSILDLSVNKEDNEKYYYTKAKYPGYFLSVADYVNLPEEKRKSERVNLDEQITEELSFYQVRRGMYVRQNKSGVCPTLTANMGTGGHNVPLIKVKDGVRKITPKEAFKLQGFPIGEGYLLPEFYKNKPYSDARLYKQAGNAVTVTVIELIAEEILKALE